MKKIYAMFLMILLPLVVVSFTSCSSSSTGPSEVEEAMIAAVIGEYDCTVGESSETVKMTIVRGKGSRVNIALPKVFDAKTLIYTNLKIEGAELGGTLASINVLYKGDASATVAPTYAPEPPMQVDVKGIVSTGKKVDFTIKITDGATVRTIKIVNKISKEALVNAVVGDYNTSVGGGNETVVVSIVKGPEDQVNITLPKVFVDGAVAYENFKIVGVDVGDPVTAVKMSFLGKALAGAGAGTEVQTEVSGTIAGDQINLSIKIGEGAQAKTVQVVNKVAKTELVEAVIGDYKSTTGSLEPVMVSVVKGAEDQVNITLPKVFVGDELAYENFKIVGVDVDNPVTAVKMSFKGEATADGGKKAQTEVSGTIAAGQIDLTIKIGEGATAKTILVKNKVYSIEEITSLSVGQYTSMINGTVFTLDGEGNPDPEQTVPLIDNPATVVLTPSEGQTTKVDFALQGFEFSEIAIPVNIKDVELIKDGEKGAKIDYAGETTVDIGLGFPMSLGITIKGTVVDGVMNLALEIDVAGGAMNGSITIKGNKVVE